ncbi:sugar ABC transporter ATP-binding protein [Allopusillimonas soli]|uniref:Sugar ABC transporter ATP-binding protein n=1 Tax=Allopusillimonas soli TaxID=659016 RepID=A0A853FBS9_9BURK|nr:ATP-binding cassette domain-containing protein [Allopusillimonas soli]NYT37543.1 sugar ABC transporter ATP-binding protein [Allopusillimonas soli]TEA74487.1 sugar ABC transporter ATP-binding protein [Allopusillimonas soli]
MAHILELRNLTKHYGAVQALRGVDVDVHEGEVLAICGDNGAGKSTLIKVVSGAHAMTSGELRLHDQPRRWSSPHDALSNGVATIYQDLALAPRLSVWQNVFIGAELRHNLLPGLSVLDKTAMRSRTRHYLQRLNQDMDDVDRPVSDFSGGQRQAIAIARALRWQARIVVMDEPTAALGVRETARVLALIHQLKREGVTVMLISHNMEDVVQVADRIVILKAGRVAAQGVARGVAASDLAQAIITGKWPSMIGATVPA